MSCRAKGKEAAETKDGTKRTKRAARRESRVADCSKAATWDHAQFVTLRQLACRPLVNVGPSRGCKPLSQFSPQPIGPRAPMRTLQASTRTVRGPGENAPQSLAVASLVVDLI